MSHLVPIETESGYAVSYERDQAGVDRARAEEEARARSECRRLSRELQVTDPVRSAELDAASNNSALTAFELYRLCKQDGRVQAADLRRELSP